MLSVGPRELVIFGVVLLFLIIFSSAKFSSTSGDLGQLFGGAKRTVEEVKLDLIPEEAKEARDTIGDFKTEALHGAEQDKRHRNARA